MANELQPLSLLFQNRLFRIPDYQRGYAWQQSQLIDFWDDIINLQDDRYHYTGLLSLKELKKKVISSWGEDIWMVDAGFKACHIVDGQQRLTTFIVLLNELIEIAKAENKDLTENDIVLGFETLKDIRSKYICRHRPPNNQITTYLFGYEVDKGDYIGSLSTRLKSLTNGINGRIFGSDELKMSELFDHNAIIDISRVGSMETKSLIMGLVVIKLQEYRMAKSKEMNMPLRHITVLEEAHNLLKKTSTEQSAESSNMIGKSVEMLTNTIAEIRTYGEGFMIVDQSPNLLDTAAIRNTNTKIILRLPENSDREVTGGSMALKEQQFEELSKLPTGVAAVYQNDWQEAVLCKIPRYQSFDYELYEEQDKQKDQIEIRKEKNDRILHLLLQKELSEEKRKELIPEILTSNVSAKIRKSLILNMEKRNRNYEWAVADFINKNYNFEDIFRGTAKCKNLEHLYKIIRQNIDEEFDTFEEEEMFSIVYYICRIEHEKHPENTTIELLRTNYLKEKVM